VAVEKNTSSAAGDKLAIVTGFHAIEERIRSLPKDTKAEFKLYYCKPGPRVKKILAEAEKASVTCELCDNKKLDSLVSELDESLRDHRGLVMELFGKASSPSNLLEFDAWLKQFSASNKESARIVILDKITDPHNVGAIIRSCDQFGASLVILPEHNSATNIATNEVIGRASAGASAWVPLTIVKNLVRTVEQLKEAGFWIYGADAGGQSCQEIDFAKKAALVMGSEGSGIDALLHKSCDSIVSIPTCGKIDSLNVSVAAGVLLYELYRKSL